ncbi:putative colanic acid biosynthesis acetyltransferase [Mycolicibacterium sp. 018/SC-01/001]|uniref:DapH/DapD/GlmU-related protein n=1 Tax=Mycolicibacterium sp. 018/SC-01/001 TaxID=2592069 RepID=UPI001180ACC1|nr:DapH/DapD/GlmU-related protein [Mycolicibacterium sp. 018/SC-01/001]TRW85400.1 putative colanic acid biosynthesis acetyltransferase [Mycolicibacterium sp. 018/SC-01/001]
MTEVAHVDPDRTRHLNSEPGCRFSLGDFTGRGYDRGRSVGVQVLWLIIRDALMKWWCPNRVRIEVLRMFGARIGAGVLIRHQVKIHWPWKLDVGDNSWIGEDVWILNLENVTIGSNTCISQGVLLCTGSHDRRSPTFEFDNAPVVIGDSVWVAARATVLRGTHIGDGATVGATAVVTGDVPPGTTLLAGKPLAQS